VSSALRNSVPTLSIVLEIFVIATSHKAHPDGPNVVRVWGP
jgi:hypothetical protein